MPTNYDISQQKIRIKADGLISTLPPFCKMFFDGSLNHSANTQLSYAYNLSRFFQFLNEKNVNLKDKGIQNITIEDIANLNSTDYEAFFYYLKNYSKNGKPHSNGNKSINASIVCLNKFVEYYFKRNMLPKNPISLIERPKITKKKIIKLDKQEEEALKDFIISPTNLSKREKINHDMNMIRDFCIIQLFLDTGIRLSELRNIDLDDINMNECSIRIHRKRDKEDDVYFSDYTRDWLEEYIDFRADYLPPDGENALFLSRRSKRISPRQIEVIVKKYSTRALSGEKRKLISPHKFRATYATNMLDATKNLRLVQEQLGHDDIETTCLYTDISKELKKQYRNELYK